MSNKSIATIATMGIDIGKNSFHVVGLDQRGAIVLRQKWSRGQIEMSPESCRFGTRPKSDAKIWQPLSEARKDGLSLEAELTHRTRGSPVNYRQVCGRRHFYGSGRGYERPMISQRRKVGLA
jgi:hypothetical protein